MATYADPTIIKETSGVSPSDLPLEPGDGESEEERFDALLSELNERASSLIDGFCQRDFALHENETVVLDGNRRRTIRLSQANPAEGSDSGPFYPVVSINRIELGGSELNSDQYRVNRNASGSNSGILERRAGRWPSGWENIEVTLDWGFEEPPGEIRSVAEDLVTDALLSAKQNETYSGANSISMDGFSVSFPERVPEEYEERLKKHRRIVTA